MNRKEKLQILVKNECLIPNRLVLSYINWGSYHFAFRADIKEWDTFLNPTCQGQLIKKN